MFKYAIITILSLLSADDIFNSESRSFELEKNSVSFLINGTSTLHNWDMHLKTFDCKANFLIEDSRLRGIDDVIFTCSTTDLKSNNSLMDRKAYAALKSSEFPEITFKMTSAMEISPDNDKFRDSLKGNLFVAGKMIAVSVPIEGTLNNVNGQNTIKISGETELNMSDFDISPPVLMMGALKTGNKITLTFSLQFLPKQEMDTSLK